MKTPKNLTVFSLLLLLSFGLFSCQDAIKKETTQEQVVKAPKQIISTKQAQEMFDNYTERRVPLIQKYEDSIAPNTKFDVGRYTYYDYKTIKDYIAYIEQEAANAKVDISTLRFYFSNYPNKKNFPDGSEVNHPKQNSFFIVPTLNKDGKEYGFYTVSDGQGNSKAELLTKNFIIRKSEMMDNSSGRTKTEASLSPFSFLKPVVLFQDETSLILNHSNTIPPPY